MEIPCLELNFKFTKEVFYEIWEKQRGSFVRMKDTNGFKNHFTIVNNAVEACKPKKMSKVKKQFVVVKVTYQRQISLRVEQ